MPFNDTEEWVPVGRPWSKMEPYSDPSVGPCDGSIGQFNQGCKGQVKWIQRPSFGDSILRYCDEHKKLQEGWDKILYDSKPIPPREFPNDYFEDVRKLFERIDRRKRKKEEPPTEIDPS